MSRNEGSRPSHYFGTEVGGRWSKRFRAPGFFARGNGTYRFEEGELRYHLALTKDLTVIPLEQVTDVTTGTRHAGKWLAGKWLAGKPIVKVMRERDGQQLSSGFGFADRVSADAFIADL